MPLAVSAGGIGLPFGGSAAAAAAFDNLADLGVVGLTGPTILSRYRAALAGGHPTVAFVGDSKTSGIAAKSVLTTPDVLTDNASHVFSYVGQAAALMNSAGTPAIEQSWFSDAGTVGSGASPSHHAYDSRVVVNSPWAIFGSTSLTLGGYLYLAASAGTFTWTSTANVDSFILHYVTISGGGTFSYSIDGGTAVNVSTNAANAWVKSATISLGSPGAHSIALTWVSGGNVFINGLDAWDSTTPAVRLLNMGIGGVQASIWADSSNPWSSLNALVTKAPTLAVIDLGTNEIIQGTSAATFTTNMQTIITALLPTTDIVLAVPVGMDPAQRAQATQDAFRAAVLALQAANPATVVMDYPQVYGSYAAQIAANRVYNTDHENQIGYGFKAGFIKPLLRLAR